MSRVYHVEIAPAAERELSKLRDRVVAMKIAVAIRALAHEPRPHGVEKLRGPTHRVRVGDYRIVYDIEDARVLVLVLRIGNRRDVYRRL